MAPILGIWASAQQKAALTNFNSIATVTVGAGGQAYAEFTSIPSTYTHLQIRAIARSDRSGVDYDSLNLRFNSDTSGSYTDHWLQGNGSSATAGAEGASVTAITLYRTPGAAATGNVFGGTVIDILDYTNTNKYKTVRALTGTDGNGSGVLSLGSGLWMKTNAISTIRLYAGASSNWVRYATFALYGIK